MTIIWVYTFDDGTQLKLLNTGLSVEEIWKLQEIHGSCVVSYEAIRG